MDYTAIAIGDGTNQPLDLLALADDNALLAGSVHDTIAGTLADVRLWQTFSTESLAQWLPTWSCLPAPTT